MIFSVFIIWNIVNANLVALGSLTFDEVEKKNYISDTSAFIPFEDIIEEDWVKWEKIENSGPSKNNTPL